MTSNPAHQPDHDNGRRSEPNLRHAEATRTSALPPAHRSTAVGRKNHYGSHSRRGGEVAAILYTLFESAKLAGVDPHAYVLQATRRAIASPGTTTLPEHVT